MSATSLTRLISAYPNVLFFKMFVAHCHTKKISKSDAAVRAIEKEMNETYSELEQKKLIAHYDGMTPEQRKRPSQVKDEL